MSGDPTSGPPLSRSVSRLYSLHEKHRPRSTDDIARRVALRHMDAAFVTGLGVTGHVR